jgi:hypothetical protein
MNTLHNLEQSALQKFCSMTAKECAAYLSAYPNSLFSALDMHLKKGALHEDLGVPKDKKLTLEDINRGMHSKSPLTRKRARLAKTMRGWKKHHAKSLETAIGKVLANVFIGDSQIGDVTTFRGRFIFNPSWDAGPNIPERFFADNPQEMKMMLAQRGLRVETASLESTVTMDIPLFIRMLEWAREESGNDVDLHMVTERIENISHPLTLKDYPQIVGNDHSEPTKPTHTLESANTIWHSLSSAEKKTYLKVYPNSKYHI